MDDLELAAAAGGDGAAVHPPTDAQRLRAAQERAAAIKRDTWAALQAGRGLLTLQTALIISSRERRCRASESADEAEDLAAGIARLATERMDRR